jgi:hypothetical protein
MKIVNNWNNCLLFTFVADKPHQGKEKRFQIILLSDFGVAGKGVTISENISKDARDKIVLSFPDFEPNVECSRC